MASVQSVEHENDGRAYLRFSHESVVERSIIAEDQVIVEYDARHQIVRIGIRYLGVFELRALADLTRRHRIDVTPLLERVVPRLERKRFYWL